MFGQLDVSGGWLGSTREKGGQVEVMGPVWCGREALTPRQSPARPNANCTLRHNLPTMSTSDGANCRRSNESHT